MEEQEDVPFGLSIQASTSVGPTTCIMTIVFLQTFATALIYSRIGEFLSRFLLPSKLTKSSPSFLQTINQRQPSPPINQISLTHQR